MFKFWKKKDDEAIKDELLENMEHGENEVSQEDNIDEIDNEQVLNKKDVFQKETYENNTVAEETSGGIEVKVGFKSEIEEKDLETSDLPYETYNNSLGRDVATEKDTDLGKTDVLDDEENIDSDFENDMLVGESTEKKGLFSRLLDGLTKTKNNFTGRIDRILKSYTKIDEELLEELEEVLITADVGLNTTMEIIDKLRDMIKERGLKNPLEVRNLLREIIESILKEGDNKIDIDKLPLIIVMVGVNGVGKTTTIGKLAKRYKADGKKVLLAAADTFRAAAAEQLDIWAKRVEVDIVKHSEGADPGAVVFDAIKAAKSRNTDILIVDTAGRLHNKTNLMNELGKIFKIIAREYPEAKREVILVVDATTGQNAVSQAKTFKEVANITGIALTKLDGTAKGGVVLAVKSEVDVPVKLIGVGEKAEDLQDFDPESFSKALFD